MPYQQTSAFYLNTVPDRMVPGDLPLGSGFPRTQLLSYDLPTML